MRKIANLNQLEALKGQTYMYAIIAAFAALAIAFLIANLIKWEGGKSSRCYVKRRIWYVILGMVFTFSFYLYNALYVSNYIKKSSLQSEFSAANMLATFLLLGVYLCIGLITMSVVRTSKWGSVLGKSKK